MNRRPEAKPLGLFELSQSGPDCTLRCTFVNAEAKDILRLESFATEEEWLKNLTALHSAEEQENFQVAWRAAQRKQQRFQWTGRLVEGSPQPWLRLQLEPDQKGNWLGVVARVHDQPDDNEVAQAALDVTAAIPVGTYVLEVDQSGKPEFRFMSERWLQMLQLSHEEVTNHPSRPFELIHSDDAAGFQALNEAVFASGENFYWEGRIVVRDETRWVSIESVPRKLDNGDTAWEGVMTDITERIRAEKLLEGKSAQLQQILDEIPIAIVIITPSENNQEITFLNRYFINSLGYDRTQLRQISDLRKLSDPEHSDHQEVVQDWNRIIAHAVEQKGSVEQAEFHARSHDGRDLQLLISAKVIDDMALVAMVDISERRTAEHELMITRDALARTALEITEAIPVGTYTMILKPGDELASFSFMSERFLELTGLKREDALSDPLKAFACLHPDDYATWVTINAEAFQKKQSFYGRTRVVVNGEVRWITAESVPRELEDGSTVWEGVLIDITEQIEAQAELEKSRAYLEKVLDNIPVAIAINKLDAEDPVITFLNKHFINSFGYSRTDLKRVSDWARLAYPDPRYREEVFKDWNKAMARAAETQGRVEQAEYRVRTSDDRNLQLLISAVVINDIALIALLDVTSIRTAERQLIEALERERAQEEQLRRGIEEKLRVSLTASAVAHEIRQPLSTILLNSQIATSQILTKAPNTPLLQNLLVAIHGEARRMDQITDRISMLLRQVETHRILLDLREVAKGAILQMTSTLHNCQINFISSLPDKPCLIEGDPVQLQLAIMNIFRNSQEALLGKSSQRAQPKVRLQVHQEEAYLKLIVADNGPGFPAGFDPRLPLHTTKKDGSGVGLYVARLTIENHGGNLTFSRDKELGGAEVTIRLPAYATEA